MLASKVMERSVSQALTSTKIWYLKKVNLFAQLPPTETEALANLSKMERVAKGQMVYLPHDPADTVFVLKEGRVKISRLSPEGKEITLAILKEGELFGELCLVQDAKGKILPRRWRRPSFAP